MVIIGLDQASLSSGWSVFNGKDLIDYGNFVISKTIPEPERLVKIREWTIEMIDKWHPDIIAVEEISTHHNMHTTVVLGHVQGVIIETCEELGVTFQTCHVGSWRKINGVQGKKREELKKSMQEIVKRKYDLDVNDDIADAIGIGFYAYNTWGRERIQWK